MKWLFGTHRDLSDHANGGPLLLRYFQSIESVARALEILLDPAAFTRKGRQVLAEEQGVEDVKDAKISSYVHFFDPRDASCLNKMLKKFEIHDALL